MDSERAFIIAHATANALRQEMARCITDPIVPRSWLELIGDELARRQS